MSKIEDEKRTVEMMIHIYCQKKHKQKEGLCDQCTELLTYAHKRLDHCKFGENKGTCGKCPIHCYKPDMREQIKAVMKFSGPRMVYIHPVLAFKHMIDGMKRVGT